MPTDSPFRGIASTFLGNHSLLVTRAFPLRLRLSLFAISPFAAERDSPESRHGREG